MAQAAKAQQYMLLTCNMADPTVWVANASDMTMRRSTPLRAPDYSTGSIDRLRFAISSNDTLLVMYERIAANGTTRVIDVVDEFVPIENIVLNWVTSSVSIPLSEPFSAFIGARLSTASVTNGLRPDSTLRYAFTGSTLPAGLTLSADGVLSGTATSAGVVNITVSVHEPSSGSIIQTHNVSLDVKSLRPVWTTTSASLPTVTKNISSVINFVAAPANRYTLVSGAIPPGMTLSSAGQLSGTPTESGSFTFVLRAYNDNDGFTTDSVSLTLSVQSDKLAGVLTPSGTTSVPTVVTAFGSRSAYISAENQYVQWTGDAITLPTNSITVVMRAYLVARDNANAHTVMLLSSSTENTLIRFFDYNQFGQLTVFARNLGVNGANSQWPSSSVSLNTWAVYTLVASTTGFRAYINGVLKVATNQSIRMDRLDSLRFSNNANDAMARSYISHGLVFRRALSDAEVGDLASQVANEVPNTA